MSDFQIKQHATIPAFQGRITSGTTPLVIPAGSTVRFRMMAAPDGETVVDADGVVANAATGDIEYRWQEGDTATPGEYLAEVDLILPGNAKLTTPTGGHKTITVYPAIPGKPS